MSKASKIILGVVVGVVAIGAAGGAAYFFFLRPKSSSNSSSSGDPGNIEKLSTPANLSFDSTNYVLSWDSVSHADGYKVDINGVISTSQTNNFHYVPSNKTTKFKVQATDSTNEYVASDWSTECNYTIPQNEVSLAGLYTFVSGMMNGNHKVDKVISMYADGNMLYTTAKFENGRLYHLRNKYSSNITSLKDIVNRADYGVSSSIISSYEAKDYDSVSYYLSSDTYESNLESYKQQGYTFEVVESQAYRVGGGSMGIDSLFKLTNGEDVKYVINRLEFYVSDTANEGAKYTTELVNIDSNKIEPYFCIELTGDFIDYAKVIEKEYSHQ